MTQPNNPALGGRGKRAPYDTTHYRIPDAIKSSVEKIANAYKALIINYDNPYDQRLIEEAEGTIVVNQTEEIEALRAELQLIKQQKLEMLAAVEENAGLYNLSLTQEDKKLLDRLLRQSLKLKANAPEEIKQHIREVIAKLQ